MSGKLTVYIQVKQVLWYKLLFNILLTLGKMRLLSFGKVVKILNFVLPYGAFKYRVDKGKWNKLDMPELVLKN